MALFGGMFDPSRFNPQAQALGAGIGRGINSNLFQGLTNPSQAPNLLGGLSLLANFGSAAAPQGSPGQRIAGAAGESVQDVLAADAQERQRQQTWQMIQEIMEQFSQPLFPQQGPQGAPQAGGLFDVSALRQFDQPALGPERLRF